MMSSASSPSLPPVYDDAAFQAMHRAGQLAARTLTMIESHVQEGISTDELNTLCHNYIVANGAIPAPLNYRGFPKSICTSINEVVCHGIPSSRRLKKGDIINIDVTVIVDGWYGDTSRMFVVHPIPQRVQELVDVTKQALDQAIAVVRPGCTLGDIGHTIQSWVQKSGFSVVRDFCGHGIGRVFHDAPEVLHYGKPGTGLVLQKGHCFTIEPMINMGTREVRILKDGWTAETRDGKRSAQWEHTIGVTETGCTIFTQCPPTEHSST
jgi:methionyl aminopeptidase